MDAHHYESESYKDVFSYIENPVIKMEAMDSMSRAGRSGFLNNQVGYQSLGGRMTRHKNRAYFKGRGEHHRDIDWTLDWMDAMGVDYSCMFPTPMLFLGLHPQTEIEVALCRAYNAWLCERILAQEPRIVSMLYLPFNDPEWAYRTVQGFRRQEGRGRLHGDVAALQAGARQRLHEDLSRCSRRWASRSRSTPPIAGTTARSRPPTASSRCTRSASCGST